MLCWILDLHHGPSSTYCSYRGCILYLCICFSVDISIKHIFLNWCKCEFCALVCPFRYLCCHIPLLSDQLISHVSSCYTPNASMKTTTSQRLIETLRLSSCFIWPNNDVSHDGSCGCRCLTCAANRCLIDAFPYAFTRAS